MVCTKRHQQGSWFGQEDISKVTGKNTHTHARVRARAHTDTHIHTPARCFLKKIKTASAWYMISPRRRHINTRFDLEDIVRPRQQQTCQWFGQVDNRTDPGVF